MLGRLLAGAALAFLPSTALACSCDDPRTLDAAGIEKAARYLVNDGLIVAEVERTDKGVPKQPQQFRVKRTLVGSPLPPTLLLPADVSRPYHTSCDYELPVGFTGLAVFTRRLPTSTATPCSVLAPASADAPIRVAGLCTFGLLDNPAIIRRAIQLARPQAGLSRRSRPPSSSK